MSRRRVVVTGLGCVSPVGNTVADAWANILAGKSGIDLITKFDASNFACRIAGEVKGFDLESYISAKDARAMDSFIHFGIAAAAQAVQDAGLPTGEALDDELATRIACVIGSGIGGLPLIENTHIEYAARGPRRITPFFVPASIINLGSMSGLLPLSRVFTYSMSKGAVHNLSKNLAREWAPLGIRVNTLVPGFFPAEQNKKVLTPDRVAKIMGHTPMNRFGEAKELVAAALLLAGAGAAQ